MHRWISTLIVLSCVAGNALTTNIAYAVVDPYNPTYLISDQEFTDASAMSCDDVQQFLDKQKGILKSLVESERTAAQIICTSAMQYGVNPRLLIVMMQKEMRMITDPEPDGKQIDWAAGCGPGWNSTRGFANQMTCVAKTLRRNFDRPYITGSIDGIVPANQGTLALYRYTTHEEGNRLFWKIWFDWFPDAATSGARGGAALPDGEIIVDSRSIELTPQPAAGEPACKYGWVINSAGRSNHHLLTPAVRTQNESTNFAVWRPNLVTPGRYRVYAFIPAHTGKVPWTCEPIAARNDTRNAIYLIQHSAGIARVAVDQSPLFDAWADLGTYDFDAGSASYVLLSDLTGEPSASTWVNIDDMKFVPVR
jgi:hypothetical protein